METKTIQNWIYVSNDGYDFAASARREMLRCGLSAIKIEIARLVVFSLFIAEILIYSRVD